MATMADEFVQTEAPVTFGVSAIDLYHNAQLLTT